MKKTNERADSFDTAQKVIGMLGGVGSLIVTGLQIASHFKGKK